MTGKVTPRVAVVLIAAAVLITYWSSLGGKFVLDDIASIVENPHLRDDGAVWRAVVPPDQAPDAPRWRGPVIAWTLAVNHALGGLDPTGYHVLNLIAHLAAALLLYELVRRTLLAGGREDAAAALALACALLWAVHPLLTDSVTYVIQRTTVIMGAFFLATLLLVVRGAGAVHAARWYAAAVICCALGMLSKEDMVAAPVLVLLYDRIFLAASWGEVFTRRRWLYAGLASTWIALGWLIAVSPHPGNIGLDLRLGPWQYLLTQARVVVHYLELAVWPARLILDYGPARAVGLGEVLLPGLLLVGLLAATVVALRRRPRLGYLGLWFFLILAPTSSVVPIVEEVGAERRMYLPLAAVVVLAVLAGHRYLRHRTAAAIAVVVGVVGLGSATVARNLMYHDPIALWADTVAHCPDNARAHNGLGVALAKAGRPADAVVAYRRAVALNPGYAEAQYNLGTALNRVDDLEGAMAAYGRVLALDPANFRAHNNLGNALMKLGRPEDAEPHLRAVTRLDPQSPVGHNGLGLVLARLGRLEEAEAELRTALRLRPDYAGASFNLATVLEARGRPAEAAQAYRNTLRLDPGNAEARQRLEALEY